MIFHQVRQEFMWVGLLICVLHHHQHLISFHIMIQQQLVGHKWEQILIHFHPI